MRREEGREEAELELELEPRRGTEGGTPLAGEVSAPASGAVPLPSSGSLLSPAAVERLVVTLQRSSGTPELLLRFPHQLAVRLRQGGRGLELELLPSAATHRAALSELPALVESLRRRGVRLASAVVVRPKFVAQGGTESALRLQAPAGSPADRRVDAPWRPG